MSKGKVFSGIRPTADNPQLGNYFGAVANWVKMQDDYEGIYCLVDHHSIIEEYDPKTFAQRNVNFAASLIACGIDPERSILFVQSNVPQHTELTWIFNAITSYGDLQRMTQFKDKSEAKEFISAGLFNYPILMAADILLYHATVVPVGDDQDQHVELTRGIARRFNSRFGDYFQEPNVLHTEAPRVMSLADPTKKMSKSLGGKHYIDLFEDENSIHAKVKSAVTDTGPQSDEMSAGVASLFMLLKLCASEHVHSGLMKDYEAGNLKYVALKDALYENLMAMLKPIRQRREELSLDQVEKILHEGAQRAEAQAAVTIKEVKNRIGLFQ
jgi:tryptophanyl-tRNA synthetase